MSKVEWVLGILLAILVLLIAAMGIFFWLQPSLDIEAVDLPAGTNADDLLAAGIAPTPAFTGNTAIYAYGIAQREAVAWQTDAALYSMQATWAQGTHRRELLKGEASWSVTFYSASASALRTVIVVDGVAGSGRNRPVDKPLAPMPITALRNDSNIAINEFLIHGGDGFMADAGITTLTMSLTMENEESRSEWMISMFAPSNGTSLTMRFDANSGDLVEVMGAPTPSP